MPLGRLDLCLHTSCSLSFRRCWRFEQKTRYSMGFCNKSCGLSRIIWNHIEIETGRIHYFGKVDLNIFTEIKEK